MSRGKNNKSGKPVARAVAKYTVYNVNEPAELMDFLMQKMAGICLLYTSDAADE